MWLNNPQCGHGDSNDSSDSNDQTNLFKKNQFIFLNIFSILQKKCSKNLNHSNCDEIQ